MIYVDFGIIRLLQEYEDYSYVKAIKASIKLTQNTEIDIISRYSLIAQLVEQRTVNLLSLT